ncbi:MAG: murein biosynthesis integral membrane protein MurJ [Actinomycetota bacterium]
MTDGEVESPSLARGAAATTLVTAASRVTGFVRVVVVAGALGTTFLANTYQTANTAPNIVFELVAAGVLTSIFVPTFVEHLVRGDKEEAWSAGDALTSVALVALIAMSLVLALIAPLLMRLLTIGVANDALRAEEIALGSTFLRLFSPQLVFYGVGMIMTGALHAHRRFVLPAAAPIFNNVVVIIVYLTYAAMRGDAAPTVRGITGAEMFVLGAGTTLGVVAMTVCLVPQLRGLGWRPRFVWNPSHPAVRKGARLGAWALGYAGGYQAGLIVVLILANRIEGGVAAYQWAYTFFYLPHALFAIPIFNVMFTAMAEHAARQEDGELLGRLQDGLSMLVFLLLPLAALMVAVAGPLAKMTLDYGVMTDRGAELVGRVISTFAVGLPTYSAFLVFTRAFYALGDTKTPTLVNAGTVAVSSVVGATLFAWMSPRWSVAGLALGHSIGFAVGTAFLARLLYARMGAAQRKRIAAGILRSVGVTGIALGGMVAASTLMSEASRAEAFANVLITAVVGGLIYIGIMTWLRPPELLRIATLLPRKAE